MGTASRRGRSRQESFRTGSGIHRRASLCETRMNKIMWTTHLQKDYIPELECFLFRIAVKTEKCKISGDGNPDAETSSAFSDEDEAQDEENELASVAGEKTQRKIRKSLLWSTGKNYLAARQRLPSEKTTHMNARVKMSTGLFREQPKRTQSVSWTGRRGLGLLQYRPAGCARKEAKRSPSYFSMVHVSTPKKGLLASLASWCWEQRHLGTPPDESEEQPGGNCIQYRQEHRHLWNCGRLANSSLCLNSSSDFLKFPGSRSSSV